MSWKAEAEEGGGQEENTDTLAFLTAQLERERKRGVGGAEEGSNRYALYSFLPHAVPSLIHSGRCRRTSPPVSTGAVGAWVQLQVRVNTSIISEREFSLKKFYK